MYDILEGRPEVYTVFLAPPGIDGSFYNPNSRRIIIDPASYKIDVSDRCHEIDAPLERKLAHEMGHAVDSNLSELDNINKNENPVASALGQPDRVYDRVDSGYSIG